MLTHLVDFGTPDFDELLYLRDKILRKPLGLEFSVEDISLEYNSFHLASYNNNHLLMGCLVLKPLTPDEIKMRQVAIDTPYQNQGIGSHLVKESEEIARQKGFALMSLHARDTAVEFYKRLSYVIVGNEFEEVSIRHFRMEKKL